MTTRQYALLLVLILISIAGEAFIIGFLLRPAEVPQGRPTVSEAPSSTSAVSGAPSAVVVSSPKDGDVYCIGKPLPIEWTAPSGTAIQELSFGFVNGGGPITTVQAARDATTTDYSYTWTVTANEGHSYFIRVKAFRADRSPLADGQSTGVFSIINCP